MCDILCQATRIQPWNAGVSYAADLAARLDGIVTGVHVYRSPLDSMPRLGSTELFDTLLKHAHERQSMARACGEAFVDHARARGARGARWQIVEGFVPDVLARMSRCQDLLVLERDAQIPWAAPSELGRLVLGLPLPCIVTPRGWKEARLDCIALAWNGSMEAMRSIHAALPLIRRAARVILLKGDPRATSGSTGLHPPFSIETYLARHATQAQPRTIAPPERSAGEALLAAAAEADLLVMGAYGRSRVDEWAFGGATRTVLHRAEIPVFLRH